MMIAPAVFFLVVQRGRFVEDYLHRSYIFGYFINWGVCLNRRDVVTMSKNIQRYINFAMVILAWLTLPLMGFNNIKRYFPASFLIFLIELLTTLIGKRRKWWVFYNKPNSVLFGEFPFLIGPFMASSLWILKWTYGKLKMFLLINASFEAFFAFLFARFAKKN